MRHSVCQAKARRRPAAKSVNTLLLLGCLLGVALISRAEAHLRQAKTDVVRQENKHVHLDLNYSNMSNMDVIYGILTLLIL
jgi:hypothetical protein